MTSPDMHINTTPPTPTYPVRHPKECPGNSGVSFAGENLLPTDVNAVGKAVGRCKVRPGPSGGPSGGECRWVGEASRKGERSPNVRESRQGHAGRLFAGLHSRGSSGELPLDKPVAHLIFN